MIEQNDNKKIEELLNLERENNRMLHGMRRSMLWGQVMTIMYWLIVIGGLGWTYYYFQPYIKQYTNLYDAAIKAIDTFDERSKSLPENFKGLFDGSPPKSE